MNNAIEIFKSLEYQLPSENIAWRMHEAGVENFGKDGPDTLPLARPKRDEVLLRVDAIGLCFSDVKLITQGSGHPRITGRDLNREPVTPGHEVSLTVVEAGDDYKDKYKPGDRFIMQADIYFHGVNIAFGYALPGGTQQYVIVGEPVLAGDEGSYLIPVRNAQTGYAEAALVEPWTCVVASYRIRPRKHLKPGGVTVIVECEPGDYVIDASVCAGGPPAKIILSGASDELKSRICRCSACSAEVMEIGLLAPDQVRPLAQERTGDRGFDDVIVLGAPSPELAEALSQCLAHEATLAIISDKSIARPIRLDVGRVHYDYINYIGATSNRVADAFSGLRDSELISGGAAWFIGAAGPMGQMHVQRAVLMKDGPKKMLCTDVDTGRLDYLRSSVIEEADSKGIEIVFLNPVEAGANALDKAIADVTGGEGFDDIVVLAPVAPLIEQSADYLADDGLMNIFAGVPRGTFATLDLSITYMKGNRFVGSSGSRPQDMVDTLEFTESGELPTKNSLAAIGGIDALADGIRAVKAATFPGKTVIFPHMHLPLTALSNLGAVLPDVYAKLKDGKFWTAEAEQELLNTRLEL